MMNEEIKTKEEMSQEGRSGKSSNKGGNKYSSRKKKSSSRNAKSAYRKGDNDPNWYFTDKGLMDTVSKFAFNNFLGYGSSLGSKQIPYAMQIFFNPAAACGHDDLTSGNNRTSGINMAALKLYTTLSAQSGKTSNYGPEDLSILMLSLGNLLSFVEYGRRALGLAFTYNNRNWNYPVNIIKATGFSESVLMDLPQKRMDFNVALNAINKIAFPANIAYFFKCTNMYQNIFLDSTSPMAQSYVYIPESVWILDEASSSTGSVLSTRYLWNGGDTMSWSQYLDVLNEMINAILMSSTYNYIYGDVLNYAAKQNVALLHLDLVSEDYAVLPVYNELALLQIHNLSAWGKPSNKTGFRDSGATGVQYTTKDNDVVADAGKGTVQYNPGFHYHPLKLQPSYIDSTVAEPDVNLRIDMTRYAMRATRSVLCYFKEGGSDTLIVDATIPDHYVTRCRLLSEQGASVDMLTTMPSEGMDFANLGAQLSQFTWAPIMYVSDESDVDVDFNMYGELNYFTTLGADYLLPVNDLCYQGLFELR